MKLSDDPPDLSGYARSLLLRLPPTTGVHLPVTVETDADSRTVDGLGALIKFHGKPVDDFVRESRVSSLLLGSPGAGKSYALKSFCREWAAGVCEEDTKSILQLSESWSVPIYVDLKRYSGGLEEWLHPLNDTIDLRALIESKRAFFLIDSFNEAPRKYLEVGRLAEDLDRWIKRTPGCCWLIASRTSEGLEFFEGEHFRLAGMQEEFVHRQLHRLGVQLGKAHAESLLRLLCQPLFLSAVIAGRLQLGSKEIHPAAAVESVILSYSHELPKELGFEPNVIDALGALAEIAIHSGEELFAKADVLQAFQAMPPFADRQDLPEIVVNRLIRAGLLLDYGNGQLAFYHQSITELIACKHVAVQLTNDTSYIDRLLVTTRWDEAILFMTYYLSAETTAGVFQHLIEKDHALAARIVQHSAFDQPRLVQDLLDLLQSGRLDGRFYRTHFDAFKNLPVKSSHEGLLLEILSTTSHRSYLAALAAHLLFKVQGKAAFVAVLNSLLIRADDYALGEAAGRDFTSILVASDIATFFERVLANDFSHVDHVVGLTKFAEFAFAGIATEAMVSEFEKLSRTSDQLIQIMCSWSGEKHDLASLRFLVESLADGQRHAIFPLLMRAEHGSKSQLNSALKAIGAAARERLYSQIVAAMRIKDRDGWTSELLRVLAMRDRSARTWIEENVDTTSGVIRLAMLSMLGGTRTAEMWQSMQEVFGVDRSTFEDWEYGVLGQLKHLTWEDHEDLLFAIMERRDESLMSAFLGGERHVTRKVGWQWLQSYLPWLAQSLESGWRTAEICFCCFFYNNCEEQSREEILRAFNEAQCPYRDVVARSVLEWMKPLAIDDFAEESLEFLIDGLHRYKVEYREEILCIIGTEAFVTERLLPRLNEDSNLFQQNLRAILAKLGEKHRRRYVIN